MSFLTDIARDCLEAERDLGAVSMLYGGKSYPVAATLTQRGTMLVVGGKEVEIKLTLRVRYAGTTSGGRTWEFTPTTMPRSGQKLTYKNVEYRIANVNNAHETFLELDLMEVNR